MCVLSLDEVDRYTISDVVLPCVGTSSTLPANKVGGRLTEIMAALGVSLASFRYVPTSIASYMHFVELKSEIALF